MMDKQLDVVVFKESCDWEGETFVSTFRSRGTEEEALLLKQLSNLEPGGNTYHGVIYKDVNEDFLRGVKAAETSGYIGTTNYSGYLDIAKFKEVVDRFQKNEDEENYDDDFDPLYKGGIESFIVEE